MLRDVPSDAQKEESMDYNYYTQAKYPMRVFEDLIAASDFGRFLRILQLHDRLKTQELSDYSWYTMCAQLMKWKSPGRNELIFLLIRRGNLQDTEKLAYRNLIEIARGNEDYDFEQAFRQEFNVEFPENLMPKKYKYQIRSYKPDIEEYASSHFELLYPIAKLWEYDSLQDARFLNFVGNMTAGALTGYNMQTIFLRAAPVEYWDSLLFRRRVAAALVQVCNEHFCTKQRSESYFPRGTHVSACVNSFEHGRSEFKFWQQQIYSY